MEDDLKLYIERQKAKGIHESDLWPHIVNWSNESVAEQLLPKPWPEYTGKTQQVVIPNHGPGNELKQILIELDVIEKENCGCNDFVAKMNLWGVEGCIEHREEIINQLKSNATISQAMKSSIKFLKSRYNPIDPFGSLVNEAIRRCKN